MIGDPMIERAKRLALSAMRRLALFRSRSYRAVFLPGGAMTRDSEIVLADLRDQGFLNRSTFHPDPHEAAKRQGRRELALRIVQHLNLDEAKIQQLVEIDDGLGG